MGKHCVTLKIVVCLSISTIGRRCVTIKAVCIHVHMSDNRRMLCDAEDSWLPVDVDNRETLCDDESDLHKCLHKR